MTDSTIFHLVREDADGITISEVRFTAIQATRVQYEFDGMVLSSSPNDVISRFQEDDATPSFCTAKVKNVNGEFFTVGLNGVTRVYEPGPTVDFEQELKDYVVAATFVTTGSRGAFTLPANREDADRALDALLEKKDVFFNLNFVNFAVENINIGHN